MSNTTAAIGNNSSSLDWPLDGINLVEAAAGTGKTYNIETLVLRLLLERGLPITSLLVVTFTEAAAAELRTRIRKLLLQCFDCLVNRKPSGDDRIALLLDRVDARNRPEPAARLRQALTDFDDAVISTIHGFCSRVLRENAFESGVRFDNDVESDCEELLRQCSLDFYRRYFYAPEHAVLLAALGTHLNLTPEALFQVAQQRVKRESLAFRTSVPLDKEEQIGDRLDRLSRRLEQLRTLPERLPVEECAGFLNKPFRKADFTLHNAVLGKFRSTGAAMPALLETLSLFRRNNLENSLNKRSGKPAQLAAALDTPVMRMLDEFSGEIERFRALFLLRGAEFAFRRLEELKRERNLMTFDDMPRLVRDALDLPDSPLAGQLRQKFSAGIIDEFQDTDPVQYRIFQKLFVETEPQKTLFLVGDPRQAIYFFRGGDLATYLRARADVEPGRVYSLDTNYRSSPGMIRAVNRLFGREHNAPFAVPPELLTLPEIHAPGDEEAKTIESPSPLRIYRDPELHAESWPKYCAELAVRMLNAPEAIIPATEDGSPPRRLRPGDLAVLVRNRYEAAAVRQALAFRGIAGVFTRSDSIYHSSEAGELLTFLQGVAAGNDPRRIMNALSTPVGGCSLDQLLRLQSPEGEEERLALQQKFRILAKTWLEGSFLKMFARLLREFDVVPRLLATPGGERQVSNLLQLGDLLQQESFRRGLGMNALLRFLAGKIENPGDKQPPEEELQQLETERSAVKIMTLHGSKGLEFPVVLLPTLWLCGATSNRSQQRTPYHNAQGLLEYDLSNSPEAKCAEKNERMQEQLRLAYVALTRAKFRCALFCGIHSRNQQEDSPVEWLFRMKDAGPDELKDCAGCTQARRDLPLEIPPEMAEPLPPLTDAIYQPEAEPATEPVLAEWESAVTADWICASYSKLKPADDTPVPPLESPAADYDDELPGDTPAEEADDTGPFALPGGKEAGNAIHKTLELIDFAAGRAAVRNAVTPQLEIHGLLRDPARRDTVIESATELICNALHSPLPAGDGECFTLAEVPADKRLSELEFTYAFHRPFTTADLKRLLAGFLRERFGAVEYPEWERAVSGGFLNGLIDLVFEHRGKFYIVDWKTNRAGNDLANFSPERLRSEMWHTFYFMQYLIYTVAWVKYLRQRLGRFEETDYRDRFGGVFYLFLRGLSPEVPGRGVYFDKPEFRLIRELEAVIG